MQDASNEIDAEHPSARTTTGICADDAAHTIVGLSRTGRVLHVGPGGDRLFGQPHDRLVGQRITELGLARAVAAHCLRGLHRAFGTGRLHGFALKRIDANARDYAVSLVPIFDEQTICSSVLMVLREVSWTAGTDGPTPAPERIGHDGLLAGVVDALRSSLNGIHLWSHVLEEQMDEGSPCVTTQRAADGIRVGIAQQVAQIDRLEDAAQAVSGAIPGRASTIQDAIDAVRRVLLAVPRPRRTVPPGPFATRMPGERASRSKRQRTASARPDASRGRSRPGRRCRRGCKRRATAGS